MNDLLKVLGGEKEGPTIPFRIEIDTKSVLIFAGVLFATAVLFTLTIKIINK